MNKNVLYLSYDGMTDPLGQSQVLPYIIGLGKKGYNFTLISAEKPERYQQYREEIEQICSDNNIDWQPIIYTKRPPVLSTIIDIIKINRKAKQLHQKKEFKIIHCRSYITSLIGLGFKKKYGTKFIFDMRGFWADERVDGKIWDLKNPLLKWVYKFFKKKEHTFIKEADHIISLTHNAKDEIVSWGINSEVKDKVTVIPTCADFDHFDYKRFSEEDKVNVRKELGLVESDFVLNYLGSIGTWYLLDEMLEFFNVLQGHKPNAKFVFYTTEPADVILKRIKKNNISEESIRIKALNRADIPIHLSIVDLGIFFIQPVYSKKASSPTKQAELMGMGIPLICNSGVGDVDYVIEKYKTGILVDDFDSSSYNYAIKEIDELGNLNKKDIFESGKDYYSLQKGINSYSSIYRKILF